MNCQLPWASRRQESKCHCLAGKMWCVDDCYITSKIPFTSNRKVLLRVLPYVSWCLIQRCVILPIFASGACTCNSEDFTGICTFDPGWNYAIFIANQLILGNKMIGSFAPWEMPLFSRYFEKTWNALCPQGLPSCHSKKRPSRLRILSALWCTPEANIK